ncbi:MAG: hypothetical protein ACI9XK_001865 [Granulosicoccus sp.]|jgi:hypothetical protein
MDAQHSREYGCQKHLHREWHPANKQPYRHPASDRAPIKVPDHWLGNGVPNPTSQHVWLSVRTTNLVIQLASEGRRIRQMSFQPVTAHDHYIDRKNREPQHNNVLALALLNYSPRYDE